MLRYYLPGNLPGQDISTYPISLTSGFGCGTCGHFEICNAFFLFFTILYDKYG